MLPSTPHASATRKSISPFATRYPAGGITSSLGSGRIDDSTAMSTTMPGYPIPRNRSSSHWMNASNIETVFSQQGDESRRTEGRAAHFVATGSHPLDEREGLRALFAQGNQQAAVRCELLHQRRWDLRAARGNQNSIVGPEPAPPPRPVAQNHQTVPDPAPP